MIIRNNARPIYMMTRDVKSLRNTEINYRYHIDRFNYGVRNIIDIAANTFILFRISNIGKKPYIKYYGRQITPKTNLYYPSQSRVVGGYYVDCNHVMPFSREHMTHASKLFKE